jgi:hypothetical protein
MQYHDLFLEIGNALLKREMWEKALDCLAVIQECEGVSKIVLSRIDLADTGRPSAYLRHCDLSSPDERPYSGFGSLTVG